ncbi:MAG TPA: hypothetical protein VNX21_09625 [Candidatus Thermoplasmatota archaeon]|nr:hypothetical protein [Candidatus Thermoplasmatota archaeon]
MSPASGRLLAAASTGPRLDAVCPECLVPLAHTGGCRLCRVCGASACG